MRFSTPCPCCGAPVTFMRLMFTFSPRFLRCPNAACRALVTFGRWDLWYWAAALLTLPFAIAPVLLLFWLPFDQFLVAILVLVPLASAIPYSIAGWYVIQYIPLKARNGCPEFRLPEL